MNSQIKHYIFLIISSLVLLMGYSNCSFTRSQVEPVKNERIAPNQSTESSAPTESITQ